MSSQEVTTGNWATKTILNEYLGWMVTERNSSTDSLKKHRRYLLLFLTHVTSTLRKRRLLGLSCDDVEEFFLNYASDHGKASREQMQAVLRVFLRFCSTKGYTKRDLSIAVPTLRSYNLASLPAVVSEEDIRRILRSIDKNIRAGRRDFAIIQMLHTYGVRSKQIRTLKLSDIDWRRNEIRFARMKNGKGVIFPLMREVGESLLDYLQHGRHHLEVPEVFLTSQSPFSALHNPSALSCMILRRAAKAGVKLPRAGPHVFRHAFATRMLQQRHSLKSIADMLGHRRIQTTFIYTKVDFQNLSQVALDWPEERL